MRVLLKRGVLCALAVTGAACSIAEPAPPITAPPGSGLVVDPETGTISADPSLAERRIDLPDCEVGEWLVAVEGGWGCHTVGSQQTPVSTLDAIDDRIDAVTANRVACGDGQFLRFVDGTPTCATFATYDPSAVLSRLVEAEEAWAGRHPAAGLTCNTDEALSYRGNGGFACVPASDASFHAALAAYPRPTTSCGANQVLSFNGTSFECRNLPAPFDATDLTTRVNAIPLPTSCANGTANRWTGTAWTCASPLDPALATQVAGVDGDVDALETLVPVGSVGAALGVGKSLVASAVASGSCVTMQHDLGTQTIGFGAWYREPNGHHGAESWVPLADFDRRQPTTNLARSRPTLSSGAASGYPASKLVDGDTNEPWRAVTPNAGWVEVDLGRDQPITSVRVLPANPLPESGYATTPWEVRIRTTANVLSSPVASGTCTFPGPNQFGTCRQWFEHVLNDAPVGRYVRLIPLTHVNVVLPTNNAGTFTEVEIYARPFTVSQPDANSLRVCNHTAVARDLALRAWK